VAKIHRDCQSIVGAAVFALLVAGGNTVQAVSPPTASATISDTQLSPTSYKYTLTLSDAAGSPSPIGTFWFAWVPGKDFLTTSPTSVTFPTGWTDNITHIGSTDGYAIQWLTSSPPSGDDTAGTSLSGFSFISSDAPSTVFGDSLFYPTIATSTAVAYDAMPFSDAGTTFVATPVTPEPVSVGILVTAVFLLGRRPRRVHNEPH
jgi:hypothetical protein